MASVCDLAAQVPATLSQSREWVEIRCSRKPLRTAIFASGGVASPRPGLIFSLDTAAELGGIFGPSLGRAIRKKGQHGGGQRWTQREHRRIRKAQAFRHSRLLPYARCHFAERVRFSTMTVRPATRLIVKGRKVPN